MQNNIFKGTVLIAIGLLGGWLMWGGSPAIQIEKEVAMHQMPDGTMMPNVGMDMDDMMRGMMTGLEGKTGDEFDKAFLAEMIVHHEGAVEMAKAVKATSKRPELLKLADDIIKAQTGEIEMMKGWLASWYK